MTLTLPEIESQIKTLDFCRSGSIVFRFSSSGNVDVEILTDQSDEEDILRQRLTLARPMLEMLRKMFTLPQFTNQESQ